MEFEKTRLDGLYFLEQEKREDDRGFFARTWCAAEFEKHGLNPVLSQCSVSYNKKKGTLRGMHFQKAPHAEAKVVLCTNGAVYDVLIDLRPGSTTFKQWLGVELTRENRRMVYIPEGFAHGFQTLADETEVYYHISVPFEPSAASGVRWNDPAFGIKWPEVKERVLSPKDQAFPLYTL